MMCGHHPRGPRRSDTGSLLTTPRDPAERISTAERQRAIDQLRHHTGEGRLDLDEFGDRVTTVLEAHRAGELAAVLDGLPPVTPPAERRRQVRHATLAAFGPYLAVMALLLTIWLVSGAGYFWPIWPMLGWGIPLALGARQAARATTQATG